jgi:SsrA-binding protein
MKSGDLAENRRARFDYQFEEVIEAGIELLGHEVKAVKNGRLELAGTYALIRHGEAWLLNAQIPPYQPANVPESYKPDRSRRLLLHKEELRRIAGKLAEKGTILVPLRAYAKRGRIKIEIGLGHARKAHDKREVIKKREAQKEIRNAKA